MTTNDTLLVIDGHSVAFRAFYALPAENFHASNGQCTNAVYGFATMLVKMIEDYKPTHIGVAFDLSRHSFRTDIFPQYKAQRDETPEEFRGQIPLIKQLLDAMGISYFEMENYEADDIVATLSHTAASQRIRTLIASGDRDTFQLINDHVSVIYPGRSPSDLRVMTPDAVEDKYGVPPERYPEIAAIVGETADNLPGVPGVGPKTAAAWINKYDGLDALCAHANELGGKRGKDFRAHIDDVRRNRELNRLCTDLSLGRSLSELSRTSYDRGAINSLCDELSIGGLRRRIFASDIAATNDTETKDTKNYSATDKAHNSPLLSPPPATMIAAGELRDWLKNHAKGRVSFLIKGAIHPGRSQAETIVLCCEKQAGIFDFLHAHPDDLDALETFLNHHDALITHDQKSAWHGLRSAGIDYEMCAEDVSLAGYVCRPAARSYDVATLSRHYLHADIEAPDENESPKGQVEFDFGEKKQTQDIKQTFAIGLLHDPLAAAISQSGQDKLLYDVELPVQRLLTHMEHCGIAMDTQSLQELRDDYDHQARCYEEMAHRTAGEVVNLNSPKQLQRILFDNLSMPKTRKTKSGYTTNASALRDLFDKTQHPFLEQLLAYRDKTKLVQIVEGLINATDDDERIHSTFQQTVTATGRLSSTDPNLQNIPMRTPDGRQIRTCFIAGVSTETSQPYECLMTADYSQIEMRIMAHMSADTALIEAFEAGEDLHKTMAAMVYDLKLEDVTQAKRSQIKATSYGLAYGLSAFGLSQQLHIDVGEAKLLMKQYFERFGGVQKYLRKSVEKARQSGYTETLLGRRRYLPELTSSSRMVRQAAERAALNAPIQGSAADIIKLAMIDVDKQLRENKLQSRMLLQIHDELVLEIAPGEAATVEELVTRCMRETMKLDVPLEVSVGRGRSWLDAAHG